MKNSKLIAFVMTCTVSIAANIALAVNEIKVIIWEGGSSTTLFYDENEDFSIPFTTNMDLVFIYSPTTTHSIGRVTFT